MAWIICFANPKSFDIYLIETDIDLIYIPILLVYNTPRPQEILIHVAKSSFDFIKNLLDVSLDILIQFHIYTPDTTFD